MKRLYFFVLEIVPLTVGEIYDELPSHLTLMSRFWSDLSPDELAEVVRPVFAQTMPVGLVFGETTQLGPKQVTAHMVKSADEQALHRKLLNVLESVYAESQYPQFIGDGHKPHVTHREGGAV